MKVSCLHPYRIYRHTTSVYVNGQIVSKSFPDILVGCGKCPLCLGKKGNEWKFRLKQTMKHATDCWFVTLTYDNTNLPKRSDNGKIQLQRFFKRLRKNYNLSKVAPGFKYFAVAELGGDFGRIHYHILFFNTGWNWYQMHYNAKKTWGNGIVYTEDMNLNRIAYVTKYIHQNIYRKPAYAEKYVELKYSNGQSHIKKVKIRRPNYFFMMCSKGIGLELIESSAMIKYLVERGDGTIKDGDFTISIPRYYIEKLPDADKVKAIRLLKAADYTKEVDNMWYEYDEKASYCMHNNLPEPDLPLPYLEAQEKARQILKKCKKYKFTTPPE